MAELIIVKGDATKPEGLGLAPIILPHVCNDCPGGAWGSGFVLAINKAFGLEPKNAYHSWAAGNKFEGDKKVIIRSYACENKDFLLGNVQFVKLPQKLVIANMVAQHGVGFDFNGRPPIRYGALGYCMRVVANMATNPETGKPRATIVAPRFGSELAGGEWKAIKQMILEYWVDSGLNVVVYEWVP